MTPMTAARFLDLFLAHGGDYYIRPDGRVVLRGSRQLLADLAPKLHQIGREAIIAEIHEQNRASLERLALLLGDRAAGATPGSAA